MYTQQPKKMLIINILDILRKHTDANHRLSQKEIIEILQRDYAMTADRKAVKRNLMNLLDFGYEIQYTETVRKNSRGEEEILYTDWYLEREFSDAELRLLIDSLLFSQRIPYSQCRELIGKIEGLSSRYFKSRMRHVCNLSPGEPENKELFLTIEVLDEAIERGLQVTFHYGDFGTDKAMHLRTTKYGNPSRYLVNPYQMVATNGRYYLIGNVDRYDNVAHYRVDHIRNIELTDTPIKPQHEVEGLEHGLNLARHMAERVYMFTGEGQPITMRTTVNMADDLIDWFGSNVTFTDETEGSVIARVTANPESMRYWALQYAPYVTILSPQSLADQVAQDMRDALGRYEKSSTEK